MHPDRKSLPLGLMSKKTQKLQIQCIGIQIKEMSLRKHRK